MEYFFTFILFLLGLVLASFINALLYRIDNGYKYPDIFIKGSHCEKCGKLLKVYELIPILSFILFNGRCSKCGYRVPIYYPISELFLGIGFASIYFYSYPFIFYIILLFLFIFSYFDRLTKSVPAILVDVFLFLSIAYFIVYFISIGSFSPNAILIGIGLCVVILLLGLLLKKPFGLGDILVLLGLSISMDIEMYIGYIYLFLIISTISAIIYIRLKKISIKTSIPLLPFMYISFSILLLIYDYIVKYIELFYY